MVAYSTVAMFVVLMTWMSTRTLSRVSGPAMAYAGATTEGQVSSEQPKRGPLTRWTVFDAIAVVTLVCFSAIRWNVGTDFPMYQRDYIKIDPTYWDYFLQNTDQEYGYTWLSLALKTVSGSPHLIFWVTSILTVVPIYATIKKCSINPTLAVALYIGLAFFVTPFNIVRQGVAIAILMYAATFIKDKKWVFATLSVLAAAFHMSAVVVAVIMYTTVRAKPTAQKALWLLAFGVFAAFAFPRIGFITEFINYLNPRYEIYLVPHGAGIGTFLVIAVRIALVMYAIYLGSKLGGFGADRIFAMWSSIGLVFLILGTQAVVWARMEYYFGIFLVLLVPNMIAKYRAIDKRHADLASIALYLGAAVYLTFYVQRFANLLPYQTWVTF